MLVYGGLLDLGYTHITGPYGLAVGYMSIPWAYGLVPWYSPIVPYINP